MNPVKRFEKNTQGRDFVVGDIHGMFRALDYKLIEVNFNPEVDRLFCVGDLVDRGPDSADFSDWLAKHWFHSVRGNHEQMVIDAIRDEDGDMGAAISHFQNGGAWMYGLPEVEQQCYAILCEELPLGIEVETDGGLVGIIHAECPMDDWELFKSLYSTNEPYFEAVAMWSRKRISSGFEGVVNGVAKLYVGHTPAGSVRSLGNVEYIDTGACFKNGKITLVQIQ